MVRPPSYLTGMDTKEQIINELAHILYARLEPKREVKVRCDHGCWELWIETAWGRPRSPHGSMIKPTKLLECCLAEKPDDERVYITLRENYDDTKVTYLSDPEWIDKFLENAAFFLAHVP